MGKGRVHNCAMESRVLLVDDDQELCELLADYLQQQGFQVHAVHDGDTALPEIERQAYDAVVLDIMLPGTQGLDILRKLRESSHIPLVMLTARGEDTDRIVGLELGADDYLPKPCNPRELVARLRAVLRRSGGEDSRGASAAVEISAGDTRLNSATREASHGQHNLALTSAEFNLLRLLVSRAGRAVDKETLSREALGRPLSAYDRSVDVHISKIRRKLAAAGATDLIVSVRGQGYQFAVDASA